MTGSLSLLLALAVMKVTRTRPWCRGWRTCEPLRRGVAARRASNGLPVRVSASLMRWWRGNRGAQCLSSEFPFMNLFDIYDTI